MWARYYWKDCVRPADPSSCQKKSSQMSELHECETQDLKKIKLNATKSKLSSFAIKGPEELPQDIRFIEVKILKDTWES